MLSNDCYVAQPSQSSLGHALSNTSTALCALERISLSAHSLPAHPLNMLQHIWIRNDLINSAVAPRQGLFVVKIVQTIVAKPTYANA